ncbi:MAG: hypothetical protein V3V20_05535 [Algisphaera sp.]
MTRQQRPTIATMATAALLAAAVALLLTPGCESSRSNRASNRAQNKVDQRVDRAANKTERRVDQKVDRAIDRGLDRIFQ